ncbi:MAG TPA: hypothetical protein VK563_08200 [Puia sp.]|nr:hypothetical protein [Puia sp.]
MKKALLMLVFLLAIAGFTMAQEHHAGPPKHHKPIHHKHHHKHHKPVHHH